MSERPEHTMLIRAPSKPPAAEPLAIEELPAPEEEEAPVAGDNHEHDEGAGVPERTWQKFVFSGLEHVSKRDALLLRNLEWLLPPVKPSGEVGELVRDRLKELLEEEISLTTDYAHVVPFSELSHYVGETTFLAVLVPQPNKTRGLFEVELGLAHHIIDLLLGGTGDAVGVRALTDIEEGVMSYVLIELLKVLTPSLDEALPKLRLEGVVSSFSEVRGLVPETEKVTVMQLHARFGAAQGYVRVVLPEDILGLVSPPDDADARRARRATDADAHASRLSHVKTQVVAEIGRFELLAGDLAALGERDVVLVDEVSCRPDQGEKGTAKLRVGPGRVGHLDVELFVEGARYKAKITGVTMGAPAPSSDVIISTQGGGGDDEVHTTPGSGRNDVESEAGAAGADLMNDIPLQIAIEMGRVPATAEEVVSLKVGHVFDLNRVAGEPVDLSVNGKIVARGELVEIDGNLGVRILSLAG